MSRQIIVDSELKRRISMKLEIFRRNKSWNKVFIISPLKTGTTSLKSTFDIFGFSTSAIGKTYQFEGQPISVDSLTLDCIKGNYKNINSFVSHFDYFVDNPFGLGSNFVMLDALFPNSKFIFSRRDPEEWFNSWINFWNLKLGISIKDSRFNVAKMKQSLGPIRMAWIKHYFINQGGTIDWKLLFDRAHFCKVYCERSLQIHSYFRRRQNSFLSLNIAESPDVSEISTFLNFPEYVNFSMPYSYRTNDVKNINKPQLAEFAKLKRKPVTLDFVSEKLIN